MKKKYALRLLCTILLLVACSAGFRAAASPASGAYGLQQLLPAGHWIYDALFMLNAEAGRITLADDAPLSVAELQMHFSEIDYESLSPSGRELYGKAMDFFSRKKFAARFGPVTLAFNVDAAPELLYKSSDAVDWTFATDYTGDGENHEISALLAKRFADLAGAENYSTGGSYGAASSFSGNEWTRPFITVPLYIGFADLIFIETDPFFGKSFFGMDGWNVTNLAYKSADFEFLWPRTAYGSVGKSFGKWGVNLNVAKEGLQIGRTQTGSIIYNSTFETDGYVSLSLYSPWVRYAMDAVQVSADKFMYLHQLEVRPFKWLKAGIVEGTLVNGPFELRFLNPLMIMHSFGAWNETLTDDEARYYGEAHVCQYMGVQVDIAPCRFLRIYGLYAQNEIQPPNERTGPTGRSMPDSLGMQLGVELTVPGQGGGWWLGTLEGIYTTPFLYLKQGADWSLYKKRYNMQSNGSVPICSWIGTPFGPDAVGAQARICYSRPLKWHSEIAYLFVAHGTNSFGLLDNTVDIDGKTYWAYYPSVLYKMGALSAEEAEDLARSYRLTGTVQYTNQITLKGGYSFNSRFSLNGRATYTFVFNSGNESGRFEQGVELAVYLACTLF